MAANRRANFNAYYSENPSKLQGQTLDQAYARMERQAVRQNHPQAERQNLGGADQAIQQHRQLPPPVNGNPMTAENTLPGYGALEHSNVVPAIHNALARLFSGNNNNGNGQYQPPVTHNPASFDNTVPAAGLFHAIARHLSNGGSFSDAGMGVPAPAPIVPAHQQVFQTGRSFNNR